MLAAAVMPVAAFAERVVNEDVTLAADADWSADGLVTIKPCARINLAGHNLTVADIAQETDVITNATGECLHFVRRPPGEGCEPARI